MEIGWVVFNIYTVDGFLTFDANLFSFADIVSRALDIFKKVAGQKANKAESQILIFFVNTSRQAQNRVCSALQLHRMTKQLHT